MVKNCNKCGFETDEPDFKVCPKDGEILEERRNEPERIHVYLHEECDSAGELAECYHVSERKAEVLKSLLYEVTLEVEFDDEGVRIVGLVGDYRVSY